METISISALKTHLSAELKKVQRGIRLVVVDHKHPVAVIEPVQDAPLFVREASEPYIYTKLEPLISKDSLVYLEQERGDK